MLYSDLVHNRSRHSLLYYITIKTKDIVTYDKQYNDRRSGTIINRFGPSLG